MFTLRYLIRYSDLVLDTSDVTAKDGTPYAVLDRHAIDDAVSARPPESVSVVGMWEVTGVNKTVRFRCVYPMAGSDWNGREDGSRLSIDHGSTMQINLPWLVHALTRPTSQGFRNTFCGKPETALDRSREQAIEPSEVDTAPAMPSRDDAARLNAIADWKEINCAVCRQVARQRWQALR